MTVTLESFMIDMSLNTKPLRKEAKSASDAVNAFENKLSGTMFQFNKQLQQAAIELNKMQNNLSGGMAATLQSSMDGLLPSPFGKTVEKANGNMKKLAQSTTQVTKAAKGSLANFDQINVTAQAAAKAVAQLGGSNDTGAASATNSVAAVTLPELAFQPEEALTGVGKLVTSFQALKNWVDENFSVIVAAFSGLSIVLSGLVSPEAFIAGITGFFALLAANPLTAFLSALGLLASGFSLAYLNVESFRQGVNDLAASWKESFSKLTGSLQEIWAVFVETFAEPLKEVFINQFSLFWTGHLEPFFNQMMQMLSALFELIATLFANVLEPIYQEIAYSFSPILVNCMEGILEAALNCIGNILDMLTGLTQMLTGVLTFLTGIFTLNWQRAWEGLGEILDGVLALLPESFKSSINDAIGFVNKLLKAAEKAFNFLVSGVNAVSSLLGMSEIESVEVFQIPKLARGGIVASPTLAMIGEAGREAVLPLDSNTGWLTDVEAGSAESMVPAFFEAAALIVEAIEKKDTKLVFDSNQAVSSLYPALQREGARLGSAAILYR